MKNIYGIDSIKEGVRSRPCHIEFMIHKLADSLHLISGEVKSERSSILNF